MFSKNVMVDVMKDMFISNWGEETAQKMLSTAPAVREGLPIPARDNMKLVLDHKVPKYVPVGGDICAMLPDVMLERPVGNKGGKDWFGVEWTFSKAAGAPMVRIGTEMLDDITKWESVIKFPNLDEVDWAQSAKEMEPFYHPNKISECWIMNGLFERLHSFLGIEETFIAMIEEPEAVKECFAAIAEYKLNLLDKLIKYYHFDMIMFHDDWGSKANSLFSMGIFEDMIYPQMKRIVKKVKDAGLYFDMHSCGKVDAFVDHMVQMGCDAWNPAQAVNDLAGIKAKFGNKLVMIGGMDEYFLGDQNRTEEQSRQYVRDKLNVLAVDGGYVPKPVTAALGCMAAVNDEIDKYGRIFYNK